MHGVFHVVFGYVFHVCDCVIVCYKLRGKTYTRYDVYGKCDCVEKLYTWHNVYRKKKSGMLRLGTMTLGGRKMN